MEKAGKLQKAARAAVDLTTVAVATLQGDGVPFDQAWEMVREEWIYLPDEQTVPILGDNPATWKAPPPEEE